MASKTQRFLSITATQGAANAFVEASVSTELLPENGFAYKITQMEVVQRVGASRVLTDTADSNLVWSLCRDTKTAVANYSDNDCLMCGGTLYNYSGAAFAFLNNQREVIVPSVVGLYVVEPTLYFQLDSTGITAAQTMDVRLYYEEVKLSEVEILRLLNNA